MTSLPAMQGKLFLRPRMRFALAMATCSHSSGTNSPASPRGTPNGAPPATEESAALLLVAFDLGEGREVIAFPPAPHSSAKTGHSALGYVRDKPPRATAQRQPHPHQIRAAGVAISLATAWTATLLVGHRARLLKRCHSSRGSTFLRARNRRIVRALAFSCVRREFMSDFLVQFCAGENHQKTDPQPHHEADSAA